MRLSTVAAAILVTFAAAPAHAQLQSIKKLPPSGVTPVAVDKLPAPTKVGEVRPIADEAMSPRDVASVPRPDLVIREIRQEGPRNFGIRVANQGGQTAAAFNILLSVLTTKADSYHRLVETPALEGGREVWVTVETDAIASPLTKIIGYADPSYVTAEMGIGGSIKWVTIKSRVAESNETNNTLQVDVPKS